MDKLKRKELTEKGYQFLRAKYSPKGFWQTCIQTKKGGWSVYNIASYDNKHDCEIDIDRLCQENEMFLMD